MTTKRCGTIFISALYAAAYALLLATPAQAAIDIGIPGVTHTGAILAYTAPDNNSCKVEVSDQSDFSSLVHDVNPALFPGAHLDNRDTAFPANSAARVLVVGKRLSAKAKDGLVYSRALQAATLHWVRVTCSTDSGLQTFTTDTIPLGMTHSSPQQLDPDNPGQYLWPTWSATDRNQSLIDPQTGAVVRHVGMPGDYGPGGYPYHVSGTFNTPCSNTVDGNGFYHCGFSGGDNYSSTGMYAIHPGTGEVRFLGGVYVIGQRFGLQEGILDGQISARIAFDPTNANVWYSTSYGYQNYSIIHIVKFTYHGNDLPLPDPKAASPTGIYPIPCQAPGGGDCVTVEVLTPPSGLLPLLQAKDPSFDTSYHCGIEALAGGYLPIICRRGNQDTNAWIGAWDVAAAKVVSLWPMWSNPKCRWCTLHASISLGNQPAIAISWQLFKGGYGAGSGPYDMTLQKSVLAADNQITVTSAWDPAWGRPPAGWTSGVPTSPEVDHFLMTAEAGDVFTIQNQEYGVITGKQINANSITYTVQRGASYLDLGSCSQNPSICPKAWPAGTSIRMLGNGGGNLVWKISNPQAFGAGYLSGSGGHDMGSGKYYITSGHNIFYAPGGLADPANWLKQPIMTDMESPLFAGADPGSNGDTVESHPTYSQGDGPGPNQNWFADLRPFMGIYGGGSQLIAGSDLYKVTSIGTVPLNEKKLEPFGVSAYTPLLNISGANSVINSGAQDNNKFCIADKPGECRSGSAAGDIFVNSAGVQLLTCSGTNSGPFPGKDICVVPQSMTGQAIVQYGITGTLGATIHDTADSLVRVLTTEFLGYRQLPGTGGVKVLSDGSWVLHSYSPDRQFMMIKTPPWPVTASSVARNDFIQIPVTITPPAIAGLDNVVVAFGYAENGGASRLQCTGRQESCFKGAQPATDYGFGNASAPGVRCAGTCTIYVPGLPGQLIYVQVKYRDAGNNIIGQGPIQVGPVDTQGPFVSVTVAEAP